DEEMHVRRTVAMAAERLHQDVGRAPRRHAVAARHDRSERVAAIGAELEAAAVVECALLARRIKMRVKALRIGMPDMEDRVRNGLTVSAAHRSRHGQNFTLVRIIGEVCAAFDKRCAGNVERPLDRPRCSTRQSCSRVLCIHMKIEKMFDANTWDDESEFRRAILQIVDRLPEFALADVMLFDERHGAFKEVTRDRLQTGIAASFANAAGTVKEALNFL